MRFAHLIEAACDIFVMPSLYEPCGLNQMYSLRYGTVPIVRKTGGLADSVVPYDPASGHGTGIVFNDFDAGSARVGDEHRAGPLCAAGALDPHGEERHGAGLLLAAPGSAST